MGRQSRGNQLEATSAPSKDDLELQRAVSLVSLHCHLRFLSGLDVGALLWAHEPRMCVCARDLQKQKEKHPCSRSQCAVGGWGWHRRGWRGWTGSLPNRDRAEAPL